MADKQTVWEFTFEEKGASRVASAMTNLQKKSTQQVSENQRLANSLTKVSSAEEKVAASTGKLSISMDRATGQYKAQKSAVEKIVDAKGREISITNKVTNATSKDVEAILRHSSATKVQQKQILNSIKAQERKTVETIKEQKQVEKLSKQYSVSTSSIKAMIATKRKDVDMTKLSGMTYDVTTGKLKKMTIMQRLSTTTWGAGIPWLDKTNKLLNSMRWAMVNVTFALAGLAIAFAPLILATKHAINMENALVGVAKTTGLTKKEIGEMGERFEDLSRIVPISAVDLANVAKVAGQLGIEGKDNIEEFTKSIAVISTVTELTAEQAAESLAKLSKAFQLDISDVGKIGSILNELENTTAATVNTLVTGLQRVGASATTLGSSMEFSAASVATLISAGMSAERAGTRLRAVFTKMSQNAMDFANIAGVSVTEFRNILNEDADQALQLIIRRLGEMKANGEDMSVAIDAAGRVGGFALLTLAENAGDLDTNLRTATEEALKMNSAFIEMNNVLGTTSSVYKTLGNTIIDSFSFLGDAGNSMLKTIGESTTSMFRLQSAGDDVAEALDGVRIAAGKGLLTNQQYRGAMEIYNDAMKKGSDRTHGLADSIDAYIETMIERNKVDRTSVENSNQKVVAFKTEQEALDALTQAQEKLNSADFNGFDEYKAAFEDLINVKEEVVDSFVQGETFLEILEGFLGLGGKSVDLSSLFERFVSSTAPALEQRLMGINTQYKEYQQLVGNGVTQSQVDVWKDTSDAIAIVEDNISKTKESIAELNSELKQTDKNISNISKSRFSGESKILNILKQSETFLKKQELASLGVADATEFINEALQLETGEYDVLFGKIQKINDVMNSNKDAFSAWQQTIKQAIRSEVSAGQDLGKDVTSRVKTWQTALLGVQASSGGDQGGAQVDDFANKLQLAYDVHFGGMQANVENFLNQQQDKELGVFDTSSQMINALELEMAARDSVLAQLETENERMAELNEDLTVEGDNLVLIFGTLGDAAADLATRISTLSVGVEREISDPTPVGVVPPFRAGQEPGNQQSVVIDKVEIMSDGKSFGDLVAEATTINTFPFLGKKG